MLVLCWILQVTQFIELKLLWTHLCRADRSRFGGLLKQNPPISPMLRDLGWLECSDLMNLGPLESITSSKKLATRTPANQSCSASCRKFGFVQEWGIPVYRRSTAEFSPFFQTDFLIAITQGYSGDLGGMLECPIFTPYRFNRKPWTCSNAAAMRMSSAQLQGAGKKGGCEKVEGSLWVLRDDDVV